MKIRSNLFCYLFRMVLAGWGICWVESFLGAIFFPYLDDHYNWKRHGNFFQLPTELAASYACPPCIDIFMYYQYSLCWGTGPKVLKNQSSCCWIRNIVVLTTGVLLAASAFLICIITQATSLIQPCNPNPTMTLLVQVVWWATWITETTCEWQIQDAILFR